VTAKNDITGDNIQSKVLSKQGRDNWDIIFGKKEKVDENRDNESSTTVANGDEEE
jgi:hypothetical protein|tara:strand:- start:31 stop:195 length:165 start_codon:yes stop_codon:yes gene_type:complete